MPNTTRQNVTMPLQVRAASVAGNTVNAETRTVDVTWTTGARVTRYSWTDGPYQEELDTSPKAVRLGRLNNGGPVLDSHRAGGLDAVIGVVEPGSAKMASGEGRATVRFARDDERADSIWRKVEQGIIRAVSVGYRVHKAVESKTKEGARILRAVDWEPFEISFVAIGADAAAGVRGEAREAAPCEIQRDAGIASADLVAEAARQQAIERARAEGEAAGRAAARADISAIVAAVEAGGGSARDAYRFLARNAGVDEVREALGFRPAADAWAPGALAAAMRSRYAEATTAAAHDGPAGTLADAMRARFTH